MQEEQQAYPVLVQEGFALHEHVILAEAAIEEVTNAGVVGYHEPADTVC